LISPRGFGSPSTRGGFAHSSLANSNPPSQTVNFVYYRSVNFSDSSVPPKSAVFADSRSAEADSTGKRGLVVLIAEIGGAAVTIAVVVGLAVLIRRRLSGDRDSGTGGKGGALTDDPATLWQIDASEPLRGSLL
jgi:hypothetical protein